MIWYDMIWYDMIWYDIWFDMIYQAEKFLIIWSQNIQFQAAGPY